MLRDDVRAAMEATLAEIAESGLLKTEQQIVTPQGALIGTAAGELINL